MMSLILNFVCMQQGAKRMPGIAVTKSVVATEPGGRKREEIFVDIIEKISITFSSSVSTLLHLFMCHEYRSFVYDFQC